MMKNLLAFVFLLSGLCFTTTFAADGPAVQITTLEKQGGAFTRLQFKALRKNVTLRGFTLERSGDGKYYEYDRAKTFYGKDYDVIGFTKVKSAFGFFGKGTDSPDKVDITFKEKVILPVNEPREFEIWGIASKGNEISETDVLSLVDIWADATDVFIDEEPDIESFENEDTAHRLEVNTISPDKFTITSKNGGSTLERIIFYNEEQNGLALKYHWNGMDMKTDFYTSLFDLLNIPLEGRIHLSENQSITIEMVPYTDFSGISIAHVVSDAQKGYVDGEYRPTMDREYLAKNNMAAIHPKSNKIRVPEKKMSKGKYSNSKHEDIFDKASKDLNKKEQEKKRERHLMITKKEKKELPEVPVANLPKEEKETKNEFVKSRKSSEIFTTEKKAIEPAESPKSELVDKNEEPQERKEKIHLVKDPMPTPQKVEKKSLWHRFWKGVDDFFQ